MFIGVRIEDFNQCFTCENECKSYIIDLKLENGFHCRKCGCESSGRGHTSYHLRCLNCNYEESATSNTLFHKLKIPLKKAFGMLYRISIPTSAISFLDLAREYGINPKTVGRFVRKVRQVMILADYENGQEATGEIKSLDSLIILGGEKHLNGLQQIGISVQKDSVNSSNQNVYVGVFDPSEKINCELLFGKYVKENKDIDLWNFKTWLTGTHHRCSLKHLQGYINQFFFKRYCQGKRSKMIHTLLENIVRSKPLPRLRFAPK